MTENTFAPMMPRVSGDSGVSAIRKSSSGATFTRSSRCTMRSKAGVGRGLPLMPTTVMCNVLQIGARYSAIRPTPRMPTVLPASSADGQRSQALFSCARTERGRSRASDSMNAIVASDTGAPWMPRMLVTNTSLPSEGRSTMLSTPVPSAWIHFSLGASRTTWSAIGGEKHSRMSVSAIKGSTRVWWPTTLMVSCGNCSSSMAL